jgi:hypothetical protein
MGRSTSSAGEGFMRNRLFGPLPPARGASQKERQPPRRLPRRFDAGHRPLDPEVTVEHAFESFATEDPQILGLAPEIAPVVPEAIESPAPSAPAASAASVSEPMSLAAPPALASTGLNPRTVPTGVLAPDWPMLVPKNASSTREQTTPDARSVENTAPATPVPANPDHGASDVKVSAAIALLVGWVVALAMAGMAFLAEGPRLLPAVKSAIVKPAAPPPPVVQTHRTEDVHLPSPEGSRPKKGR